MLLKLGADPSVDAFHPKDGIAPCGKVHHVASVIDHGFSLRIIELRIMIRAADFKKWALLDLLLERSNISREDKIDTTELAGAIIFDNSDCESAPLFPKAFEYWR